MHHRAQPWHLLKGSLCDLEGPPRPVSSSLESSSALAEQEAACWHCPARSVVGKLLRKAGACSLSWGGGHALPILLSEKVLHCENTLPSCHREEWQNRLRKTCKRTQRGKQIPSPENKKMYTPKMGHRFIPPLPWADEGNRSNDTWSHGEMVKTTVLWACLSSRSKEGRRQVPGGAAHP